MIAAEEYHAERHPKHDVFKGHLLSAKTKAVVILGQNEKDDLIVFKSKKVPKCRKYNVDLEVKLKKSQQISIVLEIYFLNFKFLSLGSRGNILLA